MWVRKSSFFSFCIHRVIEHGNDIVNNLSCVGSVACLCAGGTTAAADQDARWVALPDLEVLHRACTGNVTPLLAVIGFICLFL